MPDDDIRCATCRRELWGDLDDDPIGHAGEPICGACKRDRDHEREDDFILIDLLDGNLDGRVD